MYKFLNSVAVIATILTLSGTAALAQDLPEVVEALKVEGARVTLPVSVAVTKDVFTPEFIRSARENWGNFHFQMGGDHALYYSMHLGEFMPSAEASPNVN